MKGWEHEHQQTPVSELNDFIWEFDMAIIIDTFVLFWHNLLLSIICLQPFPTCLLDYASREWYF